LFILSVTLSLEQKTGQENLEIQTIIYDHSSLASLLQTHTQARKKMKKDCIMTEIDHYSTFVLSYPPPEGPNLDSSIAVQHLSLWKETARPP